MGGMPAPAASLTVRYWASAAAAAGRETTRVEGATVGEALTRAVDESPALAVIVEASSILLDGVVTSRDAPVADGSTIEVLPPFAGG